MNTISLEKMCPSHFEKAGLTWFVFKLGAGNACPRNKDIENIKKLVLEKDH